ncbi:MAG: alpha/beta fold hydrolase [Gammaproteobacteria bacterium]|nr:alpha/beta fold hydrolase [Gammaproteobacteria bacterium]
MNEAIELACTETGNGPAVVLLHGLLGNGRNLAPMARVLADEYRVLTPDLRNHGQSPHTETMDYPELAADLIALLDKNRIDRAALAGHSLGGKIVMTTALLYPDRVTKLVSLDMAPVPYAQTLGDLLETLQRLPLDTIRNRKDADEWLRCEGVEEKRLRGFLLQNLVRDKDGYCWRVNLETLRSQRQTMTGFPDTAEPWPGPALFLYGENSDYVLPEHHAEIRRLFPAAEIEEVPNTGHWLHAERPQPIADRLKKFLAG